MLHEWKEFYGLIGTAAAALVALLFVAASIGTGYMSVDRSSPTHTFTTPVLYHYTFVLFVSLIALVPINTDISLAIIVGVSALVSLLYSTSIVNRVLRSSAIDTDDRFSYGVSPPVAYVAVLAASVLLWRHSEIGAALLAGALILLLLVNIRNAWDLTVYFAQRRGKDEAPPPSSPNTPPPSP
jgi:hypothetical protein